MESIPEGLIYSNNSVLHKPTYDTWIDLINSAQSTIDIASFYWTLLPGDVLPTDPSADKVSI